MSLRATIEPSIRQILGAPDIEQANVTAKSVRKRLIESGTDQDLIRDNKEEITALIVEIFTEMFPNAAAQAPATVAQEPPKTPLKRKREDILKEEDSVVPPSSPPIKIVDQIKGKSRSKYGDLDDDEKAAKKLDQALNGERSLRGGSKRGDSKKKRSTESNRGKRVKSKATIDDESDDDGSQAAPKRRKANEGGGTGGGFQKELMLSSELQDLLGADRMSRPQVVKKIWEYIKGNALQKESNKRLIICDDKLKAVFRTEEIDMFAMNKVLSNHLRAPGE